MYGNVPTDSSAFLNSEEMKGHIRWFLLSLQGGEEKNWVGV